MHVVCLKGDEERLIMLYALTTILTRLSLLAATLFGASAREEATSARAELGTLQGRVPTFRVIPLPLSPGEVVLMPEQSLTVEHLRGVDLDDDPPILGQPAKPFGQRMTDDFQPGEAPYVAKNIKPFRFRYFNCEFNYGGWHNFGMTDYASAHGFRRYDVVHVVGLDEQRGIVRFQKIKPTAKDRGVGDAHSVYAMPIKQLSTHLRVKSEPVAAMIEGMALVKPFEYLLRYGEMKIDVSAHRQFAETLPVVRRVKLGGIHVLITYDPAVIHGGEPRRVVLRDFDGHKGLTLTLPADAETRIFVLDEK